MAIESVSSLGTRKKSRRETSGEAPGRSFDVPIPDEPSEYDSEKASSKRSRKKPSAELPPGMVRLDPKNPKSEIVPRAELAAVLWRAGELDYLLHRAQREMRIAFRASDSLKFCACCSRRIGKSYWLCVESMELALRHAGAQIRYAAPTAKMVGKIVLPLFRQILLECPEDLRPAYAKQDGVWQFKNGSEIHVAGCDQGGAERLRGTATDFAPVDEAGFIDDLEYVVKDILMPQTLTTGGRILLASTPPRTPDHDFHRYVAEAEASGSYIHRTIFDNPLITEKQIRVYQTEAGGIDSSTWKREYLAQFVVDEQSAVIPEFDAEAEKEIVCEVERPPYFDAYVGMDPGFIDLTAVLFGYWHFTLAKLVIEDEIALAKTTTDELAHQIGETETRLWPGKKPYKRVSDVDLRMIHDLSNLHGLHFIPTEKDDKEAAINSLRLIVKQRQLIIHPRCKTLIAHLRHAIWNGPRSSYERSGDHGHFDAVDALVYLVRNVNRGHNPFPRLASGITMQTHYIPQHEYDSVSRDTSALRKMVGRKKWGGRRAR